MRIEYDIKLGFKDVMIRPKRSTLKSRSEVNLDRDFKFLHSPLTWEGIPIMAANMDTVGTFEMAKALQKHPGINASWMGDRIRFYKKDQPNNTFKSFMEKKNSIPVYYGWHPSPESHTVWAEELVRYINQYKLL